MAPNISMDVFLCKHDEEFWLPWEHTKRGDHGIHRCSLATNNQNRTSGDRLLPGHRAGWKDQEQYLKMSPNHSPGDVQVTVQGAGLCGRNYLGHYGGHFSPTGVRNLEDLPCPGYGECFLALTSSVRE